MSQSANFSLSGESEVSQTRGCYDRLTVDDAWETAEVIEGNDSGLWRRDENGSTICKSEYGNRVSSYGWEIAEGVELRPLHIENF